ncbi:MAG: hypothetical protein CMJ75_06940 [Planctomycetaceae bacterium]|nr:hypothetical protein [Planctomycetaceae bacterium]
MDWNPDLVDEKWTGPINGTENATLSLQYQSRADSTLERALVLSKDSRRRPAYFREGPIVQSQTTTFLWHGKCEDGSHETKQILTFSPFLGPCAGLLPKN